MDDRSQVRTADDDWLDAVLRDEGREHRARYLADNGFTARIATALPAPATLPAWRKPVIAVLWTVAAGGVALALPGAVADATHEVVRMLSRQPVSLADIAASVVALGMASWAAAAIALRSD